MSNAVVWFLDIDGTVSPIAECPDLPSLYAGSGPMRVPFDPGVLSRISDLSESGVAMRWLSTWRAELLADWSCVGLGPFDVCERPAQSTRSWKTSIVRNWLRAHDANRAVWTDDSAPGIPGVPLAKLLRITPDPAVGLTHTDLDRIESWLALTGE